METFANMHPSFRLCGPVLALCLAFATATHAAPGQAQKSFDSANDAVAAVVGDLKSDNFDALRAIFGPKANRLLTSGDPVGDRNARQRFVAAYEAKHRIEPTQNGAVLVIGQDDWPFPIPLRKAGDRWQFDTAAGEQELINRRIGRNELATIQTMLAYVDAQQDFADLMQQRSGAAEYAQHIVSRPGKQDGLYWPAAAGEEESPLGSLFAEAQREGYRGSASAGGRIPYHGYFFKILTAQGANAPGGTVDYIVRGKMIGGFALVAWPARYGDSGVMTFIVNHDATVYQKNFGPRTAAVAEAMTRYDPDPSWRKVGP
jgi:Protein of unknown function (DUF2950)